MSMSGIAVDPEIGKLFTDIKLRNTNKYAGFKLSADFKKVVIDEELRGAPQDTNTVEEDRKCFEEMKQLVLKCNEPRYLLYDFQFKIREGRKVSKLAFVFWSSDSGPVSPKMKYASTKDSVKKVFSGISHEFEVNDLEEFSYDELYQEVLKKA